MFELAESKLWIWRCHSECIKLDMNGGGHTLRDSNILGKSRDAKIVRRTEILREVPQR